MEFLPAMYLTFAMAVIDIPDSLSHVILSSKCDFIHEK
jgi:hypothetical protein